MAKTPVDTIVAPGTPRGVSALGMIRLSGPLCPALAGSVTGRKNPYTPRNQYLVKYYRQSNDLVDEVQLCLYAEGRSYTGEAMMEITHHGNPLIADAILMDLCARGCRMAEPGEFTRRAFLNGRMSLPQAEAVQDVIASRTHRALAVAQKHLSGESGKRLLALYERLLALLAEMEAYLDFPEEDLPPENHEATARRFGELREACQRLAASPRTRSLLFEGIRLAILGVPNAGKSSLLNALLEEDRALVSEIPGTTRDYLKEDIVWRDFRIQILDTAGLRETSDPLEQEGVRRSLELARQADAFILLIPPEGGAPADLRPEDLPLGPSNLLVVYSKSDLPLPHPSAGAWAPYPAVTLSLLTPGGRDAFEDALQSLLAGLFPDSEEDRLILNQRQNQALTNCIKKMDTAWKAFCEGLPEVASTELRDGLDAFAGIVGSFDHERMLDHLFNSFCIGK